MIRCSSPIEKYNLGYITKEECLACAKRWGGEQPCGLDYSLLKRIHQNDRWQPLEVHVSDILSECMRQIWFSKHNLNSEYPHHTLIRVFGTAVHKYLEDMEDDYYIAEKNVKCTINGIDILGTVDTIYPSEEEGHVVIVDNKTKRNLKLNKLPDKRHTLQVSIYSYLLEEQEGVIVDRAYISYMDLVGPSRCSRCYAYVVPGENGELLCPSCGKELKNAHMGAVLVPVEMFSRDYVEELLIEKSKVILDALEQDTLPEASPSFLCRYCPFLKTGLCKEGDDSLF